jgi:hypothetical protein
VIGVAGDIDRRHDPERGQLLEQRSPPLVALGSEVDPPLSAGSKRSQLTPCGIEVGGRERGGADQVTAATG